MAVSINIRKCSKDDTEPLSQLIYRAIKHGFPGYYKETQITESQKHFLPDSLLEDLQCRYVAELDNSIVGTIGLIKHRDYEETGLIRALFVDPSHQRKGIGTRLIRYVEGLAKTENWKYMRVRASFNGLDFYRVMGYEKLIEKEQSYDFSVRMIKTL
ncbi:MAG: GNAT family N-acetyltransferase [Spirochaetales bacterium]|jgi:GNAT superfamily N-acetyltransferase|nr:GNAT family N-acetyltransferase [Spirochaetales bacterium]